MPKRKTKSAAASTSTAAKPQESGASESEGEDDATRSDNRGKSFSWLAGGHRPAAVRPTAGRMGPTKQQQIDWLKQYEKKLKDDAARAMKVTENIDKLIQFKEKKLKENQQKEAIVTALAGSSVAQDFEEIFTKLEGQVSFEVVEMSVEEDVYPLENDADQVD